MQLSRSILSDGLPNQNIKFGANFEYPEKVLQFGTGNFLRGYFDWMIDQLNSNGHFRGCIAVVQSSLSSSAAKLNAQDGLYTCIERDQTKEDLRLITSLSRVLIAEQEWLSIENIATSKDLSLIVSNTTEAGIIYQKEDLLEGASPKSFPAKLTLLLWQRFKALGKSHAPVICPMELIENNGERLLECICSHANDWDLGDEFIAYLTNDCEFCSTLVDRIVSGYPKNEEKDFQEKCGYLDSNMVVFEPYHLLVVQNGQRFKELLLLNELGLNVIYDDDLSVHRDAKVRFLNGAHTSSVLAAYLYGCNTVMEMMENPLLNSFLRKTLFNEILPGVKLPEQQCRDYANSVLTRFSNPTLKHRLLDISLNSISKWKVRVLPSIKSYLELNGCLPKGLCFSLAALIEFYKGVLTDNTGQRGDESYSIRDNDSNLLLLKKILEQPEIDWPKSILSESQLWGEDLTKIDGFEACLASDLSSINSKGVGGVIEEIVSYEQD